MNLFRFACCSSAQLPLSSRNRSSSCSSSLSFFLLLSQSLARFLLQAPLWKAPRMRWSSPSSNYLVGPLTSHLLRVAQLIGFRAGQCSILSNRRKIINLSRERNRKSSYTSNWLLNIVGGWCFLHLMRCLGWIALLSPTGCGHWTKMRVAREPGRRPLPRHLLADKQAH